MSCFCFGFESCINSVVVINLYYRLVCLEDVQYFQFDEQGNMFVYQPGAGFSGICKKVAPGEDFNLTWNTSNLENDGDLLSMAETLDSQNLVQLASSSASVNVISPPQTKSET